MRGNKILGSILAALGWAAMFFAMQFAAAMAFGLCIAAKLAVQAALDPSLDVSAQYYVEAMGAALPMALLSYLLTFATVAIAFWGAGKNLLRECGFTPAAGRRYLWPVLTALFLYLGDNIALLVAPLPESMLAPLEEYSTQLTGGGSLLLYALCVVCITPVAEELVFRGLIYRRLRRAMPMGAAVLLSAVIFGAAHFSGSWLLMLPAFLIGLTNAYALEKTGSLLPCIAAHFAANLTSLLQAPFAYAPAGVQWAAAGACLALSAASAFLLVRTQAGQA